MAASMCLENVPLSTYIKCNVLLASCANGGTNQWKTVNNKHSIGGQDQISAQTLNACEDLCIATTGCNAIDYKDTATGIKCWIFINEPSSPQLVTETGVVHATLEKCVLPTISKYWFSIYTCIYARIIMCACH